MQRTPSWFDLSQQIYEPTFMIILILGLLGNIGVLIVYLSNRIRKLSFAVYSQALAISSILSNIYLIFDSIDSFFGLALSETSTFWCKTSIFLQYSLYTACSWYQVVASLDRLFLILYPVRFRFLKTIRVQLIITACVAIYSFAFNSFVPFKMNRYTFSFAQVNQTVSICYMHDHYKIYAYFIINFSFIPFILMTASSIWLFSGVMRSRRRTKSLPGQNKSSVSGAIQSRDVKFGVTIIALNILFVLTNSPDSIYRMLRYYIDTTNPVFDIILFDLIKLLFISHFALNFCIQLSVNSLFRESFFIILKKVAAKIF